MEFGIGDGTVAMDCDGAGAVLRLLTGVRRRSVFGFVVCGLCAYPLFQGADETIRPKGEMRRSLRHELEVLSRKEFGEFGAAQGSPAMQTIP